MQYMDSTVVEGGQGIYDGGHCHRSTLSTSAVDEVVRSVSRNLRLEFTCARPIGAR